MLWILFAGFAAIHMVLLAATVRLGSGSAEWLLRALLLGLIGDNLIVAAGAFFFDAPWYYGASWIRYLAHVLLLPPMMVAGLILLRRAGSARAAGRKAFLLVVTLAVAAIAYGFVAELAGLELVREAAFGHERYTSAHAGPPVATIVTNLVILGLSTALWRIAGWPWLFAATLTIFVVNGATAGSDLGIVAGNLAEIVFVAVWLASLTRFAHD